DVASNFVDKIDGTVPPVTNVDTLKSFMKMLEASIEGYKGENLRYYAGSDYVLVYGEWGGLFKSNMGTIKATGKPVTFRDIDMFKLNDEGKVVEHSSIQNLNAVLMEASMMK
ncbi:MAG: ester cyclase, partial [Bacteroidota bacterium]|nr:ester cyclase [Bacteroidota bacterium]